MDPALDRYFNQASKAMLFAAGITGAALILWNVIKAYRTRRQIQHRLSAVRATA
jgi:hypothetical protein